MRKIILLSTIAILTISTIKADCFQISPLQPLQPLQPMGALQPMGTLGNSYNTMNNNNMSNYNEYPKVNQVEKVLFKRVYSNEDIYQRLSRIETKMYGRPNGGVSLAERLDQITQNIDPGLMYNIPTQNLSNIEFRLFNRIYPNDSIENRIIRIEKEMLGAMQNGDLRERYETIADAAKHYNAFPYVNNNGIAQGYQQPYVQTSTTGGKGFLHNLLSTVAGGALTGYTPPLYNSPYGYCSSPYMDSQYNNQYGNGFWGQNMIPNGAGFNDYVQSNRGYYNQNRNIGRGSSVTILND